PLSGSGQTSEIAERIDRSPVDPHLEVQMRPEAMARAPDVADHLSLGDAAAADGDARLVCVRGCKTAPAVDDHEVPVAAHPAGEDDGAARGRMNRGPVPHRDVDSRVHPAPTHPEWTDYGAVDGPDEP